MAMHHSSPFVYRQNQFYRYAVLSGGVLIYAMQTLMRGKQIKFWVWPL